MQSDDGMQPETFTPDRDYCVYCHAPAAGPCADCGALCCTGCVELVMRFTSRRAVCRRCLSGDDVPKMRRRWPWIVGAAALVAAGFLLLR